MTSVQAPQITLIVPVYNGGRFIGDLLDSVLAQTYPQWRCVCVNDGSKDDSAAIVERYAQRDARIALINKENGGTGDSRNVGLDCAKTPYIMFADQDDLLHPQSFEIAHQSIAASGADLVQFDRTHFTEHYQPIRYDVQTVSVTPVTCLRNGDYPSNTICVWQFIYQRAAIGGSRFPRISGGEDHTFMFELAFKLEKWARISPSLYGVRRNAVSTSRSMPAWYIDNAFTSYREVFARAQRYQIPLARIYQNIHLWSFWFSFSMVFVHGRVPHARAMFERAADNIIRLKEEGLLDLTLSYSGRLFLGLFLQRRYALLSLLAWTLGLPTACKPLLIYVKRLRFGLKDA